MSDTRLTTVSKEVFISERPILWQAYLDLREFSKAQIVPASIMSLAAFIAAFLTGQVASAGSAALFVLLSIVAGLVFYGLVAVVRAPFIVIGQQHRQLAELNQRLLEVESRTLNPASFLAAALLPAETPKEELEPNLVCLRTEWVACFQGHLGMFVQTPFDEAPEGESYLACVAVIDNQATRLRKVGPVLNVTARLRYRNEMDYEIARGAWLSEPDSDVTFHSSRVHSLILAVTFEGGRGGLQIVELRRTGATGVSADITPTLSDKITVEVILESDGVILKEFTLALSLESSGYIRATTPLESE